MRRLFDGLWVVNFVFVGTYALAGVPQRWLGATVALVMYAQAFRSLGFSESLGAFRDRLRLSWFLCYQLHCGAYALAGSVACVGALVSLDRPFSFIVAFGAFWFAWVWGLMLRESLRSLDDPEPR